MNQMHEVLWGSEFPKGVNELKLNRTPMVKEDKVTCGQYCVYMLDNGGFEVKQSNSFHNESGKTHPCCSYRKGTWIWKSTSSLKFPRLLLLEFARSMQILPLLLLPPTKSKWVQSNSHGKGRSPTVGMNHGAWGKEAVKSWSTVPTLSAWHHVGRGSVLSITESPGPIWAPGS